MLPLPHTRPVVSPVALVQAGAQDRGIKKRQDDVDGNRDGDGQREPGGIPQHDPLAVQFKDAPCTGRP